MMYLHGIFVAQVNIYARIRGYIMPSPLGKRVRELRIKAGFTQRDLGKKIDIHSNYVWYIENKVGCPSAAKVQQIAIALGTTVEYLLYG